MFVQQEPDHADFSLFLFLLQLVLFERENIFFKKNRNKLHILPSRHPLLEIEMVLYLFEIDRMSQIVQNIFQVGRNQSFDI